MKTTTTVEVDTETRQRAVIEFTHDLERDTYTLTLAGELIDEAPEGITAAIQLAVRELAGWRQALGRAGARHNDRS